MTLPTTEPGVCGPFDRGTVCTAKMVCPPGTRCPMFRRSLALTPCGCYNAALLDGPKFELSFEGYCCAAPPGYDPVLTGTKDTPCPYEFPDPESTACYPRGETPVCSGAATCKKVCPEDKMITCFEGYCATPRSDTDDCCDMKCVRPTAGLGEVRAEPAPPPPLSASPLCSLRAVARRAKARPRMAPR